MEYSVQVEKTSPIQRKLVIRVPAQVVTKQLEKGLREVQRTAKIKGFRPGNVPITVVKQYYGADVRHQVFHNLIDESYKKALLDQKLKAVGSPKIDTPDHQTGEGHHDHSIAEGQDLSFTATVEVLPEIEVKGYTGLSLTRGNPQVTEADIETVLKNMLDSQAQMISASGGLVKPDGTHSSRPVIKGDFVDIVFKGGLVTDKGVEERPGMNGSRLLEVGSDALIPGFEEHLVGMRAGETKTFRVPFPADFYEADMAGKESEFTVTVNELKEKKLPTLDDEFAKQAGYESVSDMRTKAREHLVQEKAQNVDRKLRSDMVEELIQKNQFEVPAALVNAQTRALAQDVAGNLKQQGFNDQMIQEALKAEVANLRKRAESQVRASLILEAVAKKEGIELSAEDLNKEVSSMAVNMKMDEAKIREFYLENPSRREDFEFRLREDRVVKFILDKAKIKDEK